MAIILRGHGVAVLNSGAAHTEITCPIDWPGKVGNLLVAYLTDNNIINPGSYSLPSGWNLIAENYNLNGQYRLHTALAWKLREEEQDTTFGIQPGTSDKQLIITEWEGNFNPEQPIYTNWTDGSGASTDPISAGLTPVKNGGLVVAFAGSKNGKGGLGSVHPDGMTLIYNGRTRDSSNALRSAMAYTQWDDSPTGDFIWQDFTSPAYPWSSGTFSIVRDDNLAIIDVNGDGVVFSNSSNNTVLFTDAPTSVLNISIIDPSGNRLNCSSISGQNSSWEFSLVDNDGEYPRWGNCQLEAVCTVEGVEVTSIVDVTFLPREGFTYVEIDDTSSLDEFSIGNGIVDITEGGQISFNPLLTQVYSDVGCYTSNEGVQLIQYVYGGEMSQFSLQTGSAPPSISSTNRIQTFWMR